MMKTKALAIALSMLWSITTGAAVDKITTGGPGDTTQGHFVFISFGPVIIIKGCSLMPWFCSVD